MQIDAKSSENFIIVKTLMRQFIVCMLPIDSYQGRMIWKSKLLKVGEVMVWAVVLAQLVEWSLPIPEVRSSIPVIGKIYLYIEHLFTVNGVLKRRK